MDEGASSKKDRFIDLVGSHPTAVSIFFGVIASLILPAYVVAWKISVCNMGWQDDYSGLLIFFPLIMAIGIIVGVFLGGRSWTVSEALSNRSRIRYPDFVAALIVAALTALVSLVISIFPSMILLFPDC
jgi:hypothetical protein